MKKITSILLSIILLYATLSSVLVYVAENDGTDKAAENEGSNRIVIGALEDSKPYSSDASSENSQILGYCADNIFGSGYEIEYRYFSSYTEMLGKLGRGKIDIAFPVAGYSNTETEFGVEISDELMSANVALVYRGEYSESTIEKVAVDTNSIMYYYAQSVFPESTKVFCESEEECLQAVESGKASSMMVNNIACSEVMSELKSSDELDYTELPYGLEVCFAVKKGNDRLLDTINSGIGGFSEIEISNRIYNIEDHETTGIVRTVSEMSLTAKILIGMVAVLVVFTVIYLSVVASRKKVVNDRLLKQNQMLREAKMKQEQFNDISRRRREELESLEKEISERIQAQSIEADKIKKHTISLQRQNEGMKNQKDILQNMLEEKSDQIKDYNRLIECYDRQIEGYNRKLEDYEHALFDGMNPAMTDIRASIKEILPDIKALTDTASVDFKLTMDDIKNVMVICDSQLLSSMIVGLVFTAVRYSSEGDCVELNIRQNGTDSVFAYFDYSCTFKADAIDYSGEDVSRMGATLKIRRDEDGCTTVTVSTKYPMYL